MRERESSFELLHDLSKKKKNSSLYDQVYSNGSSQNKAATWLHVMMFIFFQMRWRSVLRSIPSFCPRFLVINSYKLYGKNAFLHVLWFGIAKLTQISW